MDTCFYASPSVFSPFSISPAQLAGCLAWVDVPVFLDVRREARFSISPIMIAGALRCAPDDVAAFAASQRQLEPLRKIVVYCVYGHEVSAGAVTILRAAGLDAWMLAGGIEGGEEDVDAAPDIIHWRSHALPTQPKSMNKAVDKSVGNSASNMPDSLDKLHGGML